IRDYKVTGVQTCALPISDNPAGPDADFGASPNLLRAPDGRRLVGEGAKDGVYYAVDRDTMKLRWKTAVGPGSPTGGFIGSTVFRSEERRVGKEGGARGWR